MRQNYSFSKNSNALLEPCEGKLSCTVLRGESPSNGADLLDKEAVRVVKSMPSWIPAKQNGKAVKSRYTLPVYIHVQ